MFLDFLGALASTLEPSEQRRFLERDQGDQ